MDARALLTRAEFFKGISSASIDALAGVLIPKTVPKGSVLFTEGQKGYSLYLLASGNVQLSKRSAGGREAVIKIIGPGEIFGEVVLFEQESYPVDARALKRSVVYLIPKHQFSCLLENERFRNDFIRMLMKKQRYLADRILSLAAYDVEDRLFRFIAVQFGKRQEYSVDLSKKEVASAIGTMPETLSRVLLRLKRQKLLSWSKQRITLARGFWEQNGDLYS
jgi:CRP/FNR family transcriptional regulator